MEPVLYLTRSQKDCDKLTLGGFIYKLLKASGDNYFWKCELPDCKGRIICSKGGEVEISEDHNHTEDYDKVQLLKENYDEADPSKEYESKRSQDLFGEVPGGNVSCCSETMYVHTNSDIALKTEVPIMSDLLNNEEQVTMTIPGSSTKSDEVTIANPLSPLFVDAVLHHLFQIVSYETLKSCRLVCGKWKNVSDPVVIERSAFVFVKSWITREKDDPDYDFRQSVLNTPVRIPTLFGSIRHEVKFKAFKFELTLLTPTVIENLLEPNKMQMTQLEIYNIEQSKYDNYNVDHLIGPNVKKLKISNKASPIKLCVSLLNLAKIPHIILKGCRIMYSEESVGKITRIPKLVMEKCVFLDNSESIKISSMELKLVDLGVKLMADLVLPNIRRVDFSFLQKLHLHGGQVFTGGGFTSNSILNFSDCVNIKFLTLHWVQINLDSKISSQELKLVNNSYFRKLPGQDKEILSRFRLNDYLNPSNNIDKVTIKDKEIVLDFSDSAISIKDLQIISATITNTKGEGSMQMNIENLEINSEPCLPNGHFPRSIKRLHIKSYLHSNWTPWQPVVTYINMIRNCPGAEYVLLTNLCWSPENIKLFPPNVKQFKIVESLATITAVRTNFEWNWNILMFSNYDHWKFEQKFLKMYITSIRADLVIFDYRFDENSHHRPTELYMDKDIVAQLMEIMNRLELNRVAFGPVKWESDFVFQVSPLSVVANHKKAEYYLLEGLQGKAITEFEFINLFPSTETYFNEWKFNN